MEKEIWKDIPDYEGLYQVSSFGRVRSLDRTVLTKNGKNLKMKGKILSAHPDAHGYPKVTLSKNNIQTTRKVHRLVAELFIPNPTGLPEVNHIDECKTNNHYLNLEWCDDYYNNRYGTRDKRAALAKGKQILQFTLSGEFVNEFNSIREAERATGINNANIGKALHGQFSQSGGYIWKWK